MYYLRRLSIFSACISLLVFTLWLLPQLLNPTPPTPEQKRRDKTWVNTSPYWLDRQTCRWLGLCGVHHLRWDPAEGTRKPSGNNTVGDGNDGELRLELRSLSAPVDRHDWRVRESLGDESWEVAQRQATVKRQEDAAPNANDADDADGTDDGPKAIPDYVLAYAPMVHLFSDEHFWPSDIGEHLKHMQAFVNGTALEHPFPLTLDNLAELNDVDGKAYVTSMDDVEDRPSWLLSSANKPVPFSGDDSEYQPAPRGSGNKPKFAEDTTWFEVDRDHPLSGISDPRKMANLDRHPRLDGPEDTRAHRLRVDGLHEASGGSIVADAAGAAGVAAVAAGMREAAGKAGAAGFATAVAAAMAAAATAVDPIVPLSDTVKQNPMVVVPQGHKPDDSGFSEAPAILVMVDKGSGILDAFWFFFYSYNLGQTVLGVRYGNHVGDWEHCMIRFESGVPRALFLSEHEGGQAYAWSALEKFQPQRSEDDEETELLPARPVIYSAVGSHAMYAVPGTHPYVLPFQMLKDITDKGLLWDPAKNNLAYFYDYVEGGEEDGNDGDGDDDDDDDDDFEHDEISTAAPQFTSLTPAASNADAPTSWFHFAGPWGDQMYELGDHRQWRLFGQYHYLSGPTGPKFKNLQRQKVCQTQRCRILYHLDDSGTWY